MTTLLVIFVMCFGLVTLYAITETLFFISYLLRHNNIRKALNEYAFRSKRYRFEEYMIIYWGISIFYVALGAVPLVLFAIGFEFFKYILIVILFMMLTSYTLGLAFMSLPKIVAKIIGINIYGSRYRN